jgi:hypothetical protein
VQEGVQIRIVLQNSAITLCEPADSPISILFPQIVAHLASDYDFFLSPDQRQLISPESDKPIRSVMGMNPSTVELFLVKSDSVIRIKIFMEHKTVSIFGIPPDTSVGQLWQILDNYYPDTVGFPRDYMYARRALDVSDEAHMDSDPISILAKDFELFVDLIPKSSAIFTLFCVDNAHTEAICAHPDLAMGTLLELVHREDSVSLEFVDADGVEIDLFGDAITAAVSEYMDSIRKNGFSGDCFQFKATSTPVLRFVVQIGAREHSFNYDDEEQLTFAGLLRIMRETVPNLEGDRFCVGGIIST